MVKEKFEEGNFRNNGKFAATIDAKVDNMESEKFPCVWNRLKGWYESLIFNDNAGNNGKSEHTIRTEEGRISSEFVQLDNADVQDLKLEVKVLLNIVDV